MRVHFAALYAALSFFATGACAIDFPMMKAGLWESSMTREGMPQKAGMTKMCMDAAVQKEMMDMSMGTMKSMCSKNDIRREGNKVISAAECKFGDATMKSTSVTTFTGDTAYHSEGKSTFEPPMAGMPSGTTVVDGKWAGACPAGMAPGDVVLPDGRKVNMRAMASGAASGAAGGPPKK